MALKPTSRRRSVLGGDRDDDLADLATTHGEPLRSTTSVMASPRENWPPSPTRLSPSVPSRRPIATWRPAGDDGVHGSEDRFTVHRVVGHGEGRHHADGLAHTGPPAPVPDRRDHAGDLVADTGRKGRGDAVFAPAEHRFRPVQPQRPGVDEDFTRTGNRGGDLLEPQDLGATRLMETDGAAHDAVFRCAVPCPEEEDASASAGALQLASSRSVSAEAEPGSAV